MITYSVNFAQVNKDSIHKEMEELKRVLEGISPKLAVYKNITARMRELAIKLNELQHAKKRN